MDEMFELDRKVLRVQLYVIENVFAKKKFLSKKNLVCEHMECFNSVGLGWI